jgi:hypothetical protein
MGRRPKRGEEGPEMVTAAELGCWVYCPEQWRLQYGLGLKPGNQSAMAAGRRHHTRKAIAVRAADSSIGLGSLLVAVALATLLLMWVWR